MLSSNRPLTVVRRPRQLYNRNFSLHSILGLYLVCLSIRLHCPGSF